MMKSGHEEVIEKYTATLATMSIEDLAKELAGLIQVQPKFHPHMLCVVRELESRGVHFQ